MILDALIALIGSVLSGLFGLAGAVVNLFAALIELIVGLFVPDFSLGRVKRRSAKDRAPRSRAAVLGPVLAFFLLLAVFLVGPKILNRKITLVAEDGHSLPFAAMIIHLGKEDRHQRTDNAGNIEVPRFGTKAVSLKDPRYVSRTWDRAELSSPLVVERTMVGSALDSLTDRLLKPAKD